MSHEGSASRRRADPEALIIGGRLRAVREYVGLTQKEVADRVGMSDGGYSSVERGHARMFVTDIPRFARAFGVEPAYLAQRLGLCGEDRPDIADTLMTRFGPQLGQTLLKLDMVLAQMEHGDTAALDVLIGSIARKYD
jgi:transcriptional regulator with XRE-family HTH domain